MFGGPIGLYASAHLAAATDGADWVEMDANPNPLFEAVVTAPPRVEDGCLMLPGGSGLGVELNEAEVTRSLVGRNGAERVQQNG
jgi:L-alanine-DL-glutamate epimerase-like enolase superfamily enzyme